MNESAQINPIEVSFIVLLSIIVNGFVILTFGTFIDEFMNAINTIPIPLDSWGQGMMNNLPIKYAPYVFFVPIFFIILMMVWGIKTVIKRHEYTSNQQDQFMSDEI